MTGVPVAEFNLESTPVTGQLKQVFTCVYKNVCVIITMLYLRFHFQGKCGEYLPKAVEKHDTEP